MSRHPDRPSILTSLSGLSWPLIVGLAACSVFYVLVYRGPLNTELMHRYFATHPVSFCATAMFFVGLAALLLKLVDVSGQQLAMGRVNLDAFAEGAWSVEDCPQLLEKLAALPKQLRNSYFGCRIDDALDFVDRQGSASGLDDELKYLADIDAARQQDSYALVRIIIWATPMLGFLGTVIGITQALGDLGTQSELLATDPKTAMQALLAGLYVAFDTTALALSLSIVLMFVQFLADRIETELLSAVDNRTRDELSGRFTDEQVDAEPHLAAVQRMSAAVMQTAERLLQQQTEHWRSAIDQANDKWSQLLSSSAEQVRKTLAETIEGATDRLSAALAESQSAADEQLRLRWEQWQTALSDNARLLRSQQTEMLRQSEVLSQVVTATGDVVKLEKALNDNLNALAGTGNFEDTVISLSAAIHLLSARLGHVPQQAVELEAPASKGRAA